ncbi:hypothetical protein GCM10027615_21760 [Plantactinospora veratri]
MPTEKSWPPTVHDAVYRAYRDWECSGLSTRGWPRLIGQRTPHRVSPGAKPVDCESG